MALRYPACIAVFTDCLELSHATAWDASNPIACHLLSIPDRYLKPEQPKHDFDTGQVVETIVFLHSEPPLVRIARVVAREKNRNFSESSRHGQDVKYHEWSRCGGAHTPKMSLNSHSRISSRPRMRFVFDRKAASPRQTTTHHFLSLP